MAFLSNLFYRNKTHCKMILIVCIPVLYFIYFSSHVVYFHTLFQFFHCSLMAVSESRYNKLPSIISIEFPYIGYFQWGNYIYIVNGINVHNYIYCVRIYLSSSRHKTPWQKFHMF